MNTAVRAWCWSLGLVAVTGGAGYGVYAWQQRQRQAQQATIESQGPPRVQAGRDYYLWVKLIELYPTRHDGSYWDRLADEAPDPRFTLHWQDNNIFESSERGNTLIATWDLLGANIWNLIEEGGDVEVATLMRVPLVRAQAGGTVTLDVFDGDPIGGDTVGRVVLPLDQLRIGENTIDLDSSETNGIRRVIVSMVDRNITLADLADVVNRR